MKEMSIKELFEMMQKSDEEFWISVSLGEGGKSSEESVRDSSNKDD